MSTCSISAPENLRCQGTFLKLRRQPTKVLTALAGRRRIGHRQDLADQVWRSETYFDFEHGLNYMSCNRFAAASSMIPKSRVFWGLLSPFGYQFRHLHSPTADAVEASRSA